MRYVVLDKLYDRALSGLPVLGTPRAMARRFEGKTLEARADRAVAFYTVMSGTAGFAFGITGLITVPVTVPANIASVALLQLHLCAALAVLHGRDPHDADVRAACIACVLRRSEAEHTGREETSQPAEREKKSLLSRLTTKLLERGVRITAEQAGRLASRGARSLPLVGGLVGGTSDAYATGEVGRAARAAFNDNSRGALEGLIA